MGSVDQLQRILRDFNFRYGAEVSAIVSKTGVPVAVAANREVLEEHFATMAATLMGSSEVIYRELGSRPTVMITARSEDSILLVYNLEASAFFIAVAPHGSRMARDLAGAAASLAKVLDPLRPLAKFAQ